MFVLSPLPAFFWPIFVLPPFVTSTLAQSSMFLFYDTSICRKNVWFPPGTDSFPRIAKCSLGVMGTYRIASCIIFVLRHLLVCLNAPKRRDLEPNYILDAGNSFPQKNTNRNTQESSIDSDSEKDQYTYPIVPPIGEPEIYPNEEDGESEFTMTSRGVEPLTATLHQQWLINYTNSLQYIFYWQYPKIRTICTQFLKKKLYNVLQ